MLHSAGALLVQALPTLFVVVLLHWYLKTTLFQPLEKVLADRHAETQGAREQASAALKSAELKVAEYDAKLRAARAEIYQEQDVWRKGLLEEQNQAVSKARDEGKALIADAKSKIAGEIEAARAVLERDADGLADRIVGTILRGSKN